MKLILAGVVVAFAAAISPAQAAPAQGSTSESALIPPGSAIVTELSKSLDVKKVKPGEKIEARVSMDFVAHGKNVLPRNTKIIGHVVDAKVRSKGNDSTVTIAFDRVLPKNGPEVPLAATIQAIGAPLVDFSMANAPYGDASAAGPMSMPGAGRSSVGYPASPRGPGGLGEPDDGVPARNAPSPLGPTSQGVVGLKGISISSTGENSSITSREENVHLNTGTQLVLHVAGPQH